MFREEISFILKKYDIQMHVHHIATRATIVNAFGYLLGDIILIRSRPNQLVAWSHQGPFISTWVNFNLNMDK